MTSRSLLDLPPPPIPSPGSSSAAKIQNMSSEARLPGKLGELLNTSVPQILHLPNRGNNHTFLGRIMLRIKYMDTCGMSRINPDMY